MSDPRKWTLHLEDRYFVEDMIMPDSKNICTVIEYSAYQRLEKALEVAKKNIQDVKTYSKFDDDRFFYKTSSETLAEIESILQAPEGKK